MAKYESCLKGKGGKAGISDGDEDEYICEDGGIEGEGKFCGIRLLGILYVKGKPVVTAILEIVAVTRYRRNYRPPNVTTGIADSFLQS